MIELSVIEQFFSTIALGDDSSIFLINNSGELLARYPQAPGMVGKRIVEQPLVQRVFASGSLAGRRFGVDDLEKVVAARSTARHPFIVGASVSSSAVLDGWWREAMVLGAAGGLVVILISAFTYLIVRKLQRGNQQVRRTLAEQKLRLDAALDHMHQGLSIFDATGHLVVWNKRYLDMYDVPTDQVQPGCTLRDVLIARKAAGTFPGDPKSHRGRHVASRFARQGDQPSG